MTVLVPESLEEALDALALAPDATVLAGGTDAMVEVNFGHRRPTSVVSISRIAALRGWQHDLIAANVRIGAGVTYTELMEQPLASLVPALAEAARTVGSPQIRNAGTIGGNLATCSPAGDALPVLSALDATVELASAAGRRQLSIHDFMVGVKRTALEPGEIIVATTVPVLAGGQCYAKVGVRNAMVISTASAAVVTDPEARFVHIASTFESAITVVHEAEEADGKSILSLMVLGAAPGTSVLIRAEGPDEEAALGRLAEFIGCGCEED